MMHRLRRLATALLGLLLFQASALEASVACLMPSAAAGGASAVVGTAEKDGHAGDAHGTGDHGQHAGETSHNAGSVPPGDGRRPQPHHGTEQHCPASMACATVAVAEVSATVADHTVRASTRVIAPRTSVPSSVVRGPEPPPPRA